MTVLAMLVAGALGAWARYEVSGWIQARVRTAWPWGTAAVNIAGTVALVGVVTAQQAGLLSSGWVIVLGTGFAGAFTTFSTWMVESVHLAGEGGRKGLRRAAVNLGVQLLSGSAVAVAVFVLVR